MELLLVIVSVIAIIAFRRATRAERLLAHHRIEVSQLRSMVQTLTDRLNRSTQPAPPPPAHSPADTAATGTVVAAVVVA